MSYHTVIIVGRLGKNPELRFTPSGQAICNISVATDHSYTDKSGNKVKQVTWFKVATFNKTAENVNQYLKKGSMVLVEGRMNSDENGNPKVWTRQDGSPAASYEVSAQVVKFLSGRNEVSERDVADADDVYIDF